MFLVVLLAVICSGLAVALLDSWGPLYRLDLILHPLLGLGASGYLLRYMSQRMASTAPSLSVRVWVVGPVVLGLLSALVGLVASSMGVFITLTLAQVLYYLIGGWRLTQAIRRTHLPRAVALGYTLFAAWNLSLFSGVAILLLFRRGGVTHLFELHAILGLVVLGVLLLFLIAIAVGSLERLSRERVRQTRPWAIVLKLVLAFVLLVVGVTLHHVEPDPTAVVSLSTLPISQRPDAEKQVLFELDGVAPAAMGLTESCLQEGGCHSSLKPSFMHSNHAISMGTRHMQKSLKMLMNEETAEDWRTCAGCHAPAALFQADLGPRAFMRQPAISCVGCHLISEVMLDPEDERKSTVTHRAPREHLALYVDEQGKEAPVSAWDAALIQLSPRSHGRMFTTELTGEDLMCAGCHHQRIPYEESVGLHQARCKDCHLPAGYTADGSRTLRDHFSPGAALGVASLQNDTLAVERIRRWIAGDQLVALNGWELLWDIRSRTHDAPDVARWLMMFHVELTPAVAGREYRFRVQSTNVGMNHAFPAGEFSMSEAWLEVRVVDSRGAVLLHIGKLDKLGTPPENAPRLGGRSLDASGEPIRDFRIWHTATKVADAVIPARLHRDDDFAFVIPKEAVGPLSVEGTWNYRKHSRELLDWAYGKRADVPPVKVGQLKHQIRLTEDAVNE